MIADRAEVGFAEAAAEFWVVAVGSPVLGQRADGRDADALAVINAPGLACGAFFGQADASAKLGVVDESGVAIVDCSIASATAFLTIEVIIIINIEKFCSCTILLNVAFTAAMIVVPVVASGTLHGGASALACVTTPVEVVGAHMRAALASTYTRVENLAVGAFRGRAHA